MKTMTDNQKKMTKEFMEQFVAENGPMKPNALVLNTVTHCPWANTNHARGTYSVLVRRGILKVSNGMVSRNLVQAPKCSLSVN